MQGTVNLLRLPPENPRLVLELTAYGHELSHTANSAHQ